MTTTYWIAWLLAASFALSGSLATTSSFGSAENPEPPVCGAVVDDGSPF